MPNFKYMATAANGRTMRGVQSAADERALNDTLREKGLYLTSCEVALDKKRGGKLRMPVVADFCRQISTLLTAGISLVRALSILSEEENVKPKTRAVYEELLRQIRQGNALSDAMQSVAPAFPELLVNMLRSAEQNGTMDKTARRMAEHYEKEHRVQSKVRSAMVYPAVLLVMMLAIVIFVTAYILPQFSELFATMGELPWMTQVVMGFSDSVTHFWYLYLIGIAVLVGAVRILLGIEPVRRAFDRMKLRMPIVGKLQRTICTARFARTLSSLYGSGVPIMSALPVAAKTVGNKHIEAQFAQAITLLQQGGTLSDALRGIDGFERKLSSSIFVGEEAGNLDEMLDVLADDYDYASEQALQRMVTLLEPCMLIVLGLMVGFIMLAVLVPIFGSYNAVEQSANYY